MQRQLLQSLRLCVRQARSFSTCESLGVKESPSLAERAKEALSQSMAQPEQVAPAKDQSAPAHHIPGNNSSFGARFTNPWSAWEVRTFSEVMKWQRERRKLPHSLDGWLEGIPHPTAEDFKKAFPLSTPDWEALAQPQEDAIQALWVGHATVLVQQGGFTFITDPVFSERCAPVQWAGPKRLVPAAIVPEDVRLPNIDFVLLSHNHYDHLDVGSVRRLYKKFGNSLKWYVPLGIKAWFKDEGIKNVVELDWWQEVVHQHPTLQTQATITMVPAMHWTTRGLLDRCNTLWGGYVVKTLGHAVGAEKPKEQSFYFAGDTGYCEVFKEIGKRLGPIDLSAIPIGAYEPRWFMKPQHVNSEEGLQVHRDVRSRRSLAIHCCTWSLTDEALDEPPRKLAEALDATGGDPDEFVTVQHGQMLVVQGGATLNQPKLLGPRRQGI